MMALILKLAIVSIIVANSLVNLSVFAQESSSIEEKFKLHKIVPDVVSVPPTALVSVKYPSGAEVNLGDELKLTDVLLKPSVSWDAADDQRYTLAMVDPDAPSREYPIWREFRHWLVVNIPGNKVDAGESISEYINPSPPPSSGLHRYTFWAYKQPGKITFEESKLVNKITKLPINFSIAKFAEKYKLGDPIAGNFFQTQLLGDVKKILSL